MLRDHTGAILCLKLLVGPMRTRIWVVPVSRHSALLHIVTDGPNRIRLRLRRNASSIVCRSLRFSSRGKCLIIWTTVVDEDGGGAGIDVVGVEAVDREVVCGFSLVIGLDGGDLGRRTVGGLELVAGVEVDGVNEGGLGDVVERVVIGRRQRRVRRWP